MYNTKAAIHKGCLGQGNDGSDLGEVSMIMECTIYRYQLRYCKHHLRSRCDSLLVYQTTLLSTDRGNLLIHAGASMQERVRTPQACRQVGRSAGRSKVKMALGTTIFYRFLKRTQYPRKLCLCFNISTESHSTSVLCSFIELRGRYLSIISHLKRKLDETNTSK